MSHIHDHNMEKYRRPTIDYFLFSTLIEKPSKSKPPRNFEIGGVGLGIVAALNHPDTATTTNNNITQSESAKFANLAMSPRSNPIPIICSAAKPAANFKWHVGLLLNSDRIGAVVDESDESYTCVISHVGNNVIQKHVYYGDDSGDGFIDDDSVCVFELNPGLSYASTSSPVILTIGDACGETRGFWTKDFLTSCYLCNKLLHGLDIFMYRGEKAFCSGECREIQIKIDECKEKCGWEGRKLAHDCSASPCSSPPVFVAEVAAA